MKDFRPCIQYAQAQKPQFSRVQRIVKLGYRLLMMMVRGSNQFAEQLYPYLPFMEVGRACDGGKLKGPLDLQPDHCVLQWGSSAMTHCELMMMKLRVMNDLSLCIPIRAFEVECSCQAVRCAVV